MRKSTVKIIFENRDALRVAASAARISTQQGTALEILEKSGMRDRDLNLIGKVLSSGHKSVIEHQTFSLAFNDVSVMVEQFVIEFRLASYTVKSRRYVDFSDAGYVIPEDLSEVARTTYCTQMEALFSTYQSLLDMEIPKEDARFVLPYCLRSNFYATLNARELIHMTCTMLYGRGARFPELRQLGEQLKTQIEAFYPGVINAEAMRYKDRLKETRSQTLKLGIPVESTAVLVGYPESPEALLEEMMAFSGRFAPQNGRYLCEENMRMLLTDIRPRELEALCFTFRISNISLACLTHFTRHRIQSPLIPGVIAALSKGNYTLPKSIAEHPQAKQLYCEAFAAQTKTAKTLLELGASEETLAYCAMSGHVLDIMLTMNARELLHFAKLRTCSRAQWEIQLAARRMLLCLYDVSPLIFGGYGPSCAVTGICPEGKMSCSHPVHIENGTWMIQK